MNQKTSASKSNFDLTPELLKDFIEVQKQKTLNDARELQLKEKELEFGAKHAEKALDHQALYLSKRPSEDRKTLTRLGWVTGLLLIAVMGFLTTWICLGKEQFAYKFLQGAGYIMTTALGYWLGNKNRSKKEDRENDTTNDAVIVE